MSTLQNGKFDTSRPGIGSFRTLFSGEIPLVTNGGDVPMPYLRMPWPEPPAGINRTYYVVQWDTATENATGITRINAATGPFQIDCSVLKPLDLMLCQELIYGGSVWVSFIGDPDTPFESGTSSWYRYEVQPISWLPGMQMIVAGDPAAVWGGQQVWPLNAIPCEIIEWTLPDVPDPTPPPPRTVPCPKRPPWPYTDPVAYASPPPAARIRRSRP